MMQTTLSNDSVPDLDQLIDTASMSALLKSFHEATGLACSLVDRSGRLLVEAGWTSACKLFHHTGESAKACLLFNTEAQQRMPEGLVAFQCRNGLTELARPIKLDGIHVGTLFFGQVLHAAPDLSFFRQQAEEKGYDVDHYLDCVGKVPIIDRERFETLATVLEKTASLFAETALSRHRQMATEEKLTTASERQIELDDILNHSPTGILWTDSEGRIEFINVHFTRLLGYAIEDIPDLDTLTMLMVPDAMSETPTALFGHQSKAMQTGTFETVLRHRSGSLRYLSIGTTLIGRRILFTFADITDLVQAERNLAIREQEYRSLAENSPDFILRNDRSGRIRYINPALKQRLHLHGIDDVIGKFLNEISTVDRYRDIEQGLREILQAGQKRQVAEISVPGLINGTETYQFSMVPERDTAGRIVGTIGFGRDITTLRSVERRLVNFIENLPGLAFTFRLSSQRASFPYVSSKVFEYCGITPDSATRNYRNMLRSVAPSHRRRLLEAVRESFKLCQPFHFETQLCLTGQPHRWVDIRALPELEPDGSVLWYGIMMDITKRKQFESHLDQTRSMLRNVLQTMPDLVWLKDRDGIYRFCNHAFERFFGASEAEIIGKTDYDYVEKELADFFREKDRYAIEQGDVCLNEEWVTFAGETSRRLLETRKVPLYDQHGDISSVLGIASDITEKHAHREKVHRMAYYDALTSLPNRSLFHDQLIITLSEAERQQKRIGMMLLDIDQFKMVNDTLGHFAGDTLLCEIAMRVTQCLQTSDLFSRMGGDEFALLLPDVKSEDDIARLATRLLGSFDAPFLLEGREVFVSASIGIAVYPQDARNATDLLKYADAAMYHAKRSGRNSYRFYTNEMTKATKERFQLEGELRRALERGELVLHFQPKVSLTDGSYVGSEALLRWLHPQSGMLPTQLIIQIAEETGLIVDIGKWVIRQACEEAVRLNQGGSAHRISVNLSPRQFQGDGILATILDILNQTGCHPSYIEFEITESLLLRETGEVQKTLQALRELGATVAIDDFGTGFSSLSYLSSFPIDTLKIDRSFISRIEQSLKDAELVKAIIAIGHALQLDLVAEGVETEEQARFLRENGCQLGQGYLFGKPTHAPINEQQRSLPS